MAGEWGATTIGALLARDGGSVKTGPFGTVLKSREYSTDGVPLISVGEVSYGSLRIHASTPRAPREVVDRLPEYVLQAGDIVFGRKGAVDRSALVKSEQAGWFLGSDGIRLRLPSSCDARFIAYQLQSSDTRSWLLQHATGTTMASLNQSTIERVPIILPPLKEQRAIAHILGTLDDKIELNRRMNETLEGMARALFKSWFVDFDPVRAKAEGRETGLPEHLADLFPDSFEESELGEIPKGWEVKTLSDLCTTQYGYTASATTEPIGPKFLRVMDINKQNWIEWGGVPHCEASAESSASYALKIGDLVVARMADPGKSAIIEEKIDAVFASYLVRLKAESLAHSYYLYSFLKSDLYAEYAEGAKSGSVQANMNARVIVGASLVLPQRSLLNAFLKVIIPLRQRLVSGVCESRTLASVRDALLPKLISGELRLGSANTFVESLP